MIKSVCVSETEIKGGLRERGRKQRMRNEFLFKGIFKFESLMQRRKLECLCLVAEKVELTERSKLL